jgi:hypothetical protein
MERAARLARLLPSSPARPALKHKTPRRYIHGRGVFVHLEPPELIGLFQRFGVGKPRPARGPLYKAGERPGHRERALCQRIEQLRKRDEPGARESLQE